MGDYKLASDLYTEALAIQRRVLKPDHPELATTLSNMGSLYQRQNQTELAIPLLEEALEIRTKVFPDDHPTLLTSRNMMAVAYGNLGRMDEAIVLARKVLAARQKKLGNHSHVAGSFNTLGHLLKSKGDLQEAEQAMRSAIAMYRKVLPEIHLELARPLEALGKLMLQQERELEARILLEEALKIRRLRLAEGNPDILRLKSLLENR